MVPLVTLIIPTLNRKEYIESTLKDLAEQEYSNLEVLIIDQSEERFEYTVPELLNNRVRVVAQKEKSASLARNKGIAEANGEILIFLDDDIQIPNKLFVCNHVRHYVGTNRSGVSGAILSPGQGFREHRHKLSFNQRFGWLFFPINYKNQVEIGNGWAGNLSVRKAYAIQIGGMDCQFIKGAFREESDFCARLVGKFGMMIFDPEAFIIHIGAGTGGLRSFGNEAKIRGQHHFDGMFYFLFRNIKLRDYPFHLLSFFLIFFKIKSIKRNPTILFSLIGRTLKGMYNGLKMTISGPKLFQ